MGTGDKQIALGSQSWGSFLVKLVILMKLNMMAFLFGTKFLMSAEISDIYNSGTPMNLENHSAVD